MAQVRTTRTLKVTELVVSPEEKESLAQLFPDPRYQALLNCMERACILLESAHLSTPIGDVEGILGGFGLTKGVWKFFEYVQKQVHSAYNTREIYGEEPEETPSLDAMLQGVEGINGEDLD